MMNRDLHMWEYSVPELAIRYPEQRDTVMRSTLKVEEH